MNKQGRFALALCVGLLAVILMALSTTARAQSGVLLVAPDGDCGAAGPCFASIQEAVLAANRGDTVKVAEGTYTDPRFEVHVTKDLAIIGGFATTDWQTSLPATRRTVLDAGPTAGHRVIRVESSSDVTVRLEGLVVQRGNSGLAADGGGIYVVNGNVTIQNCEILNNSATGTVGGGGGGVFLEDGSLTIVDSTIRDNHSGRHGGGLGARHGTLLVSGSLIESNTSTDMGGGAMLNGADATLRNNTIRGNSLTGVFITSGTAVLEDNVIEYNESTGNGGGIGLDGVQPPSVTASRNLIRGNAAASGGGVGVSAGTMALHNNDIVSNTATSDGGGIAAWANGSLITIVGNRLAYNVSGSQGGGALYVADGNLRLERNALMHNQAPGTFGGAMVIAGGHVDGMNDVIANNSSMAQGIYLSGGTLGARHWTLANNGDFALWANGGSARLTNTIVSSHTVAGYWGADVVADRTLFYKNGTRCGSGASCTNYITGFPAFADEDAGDFHIGSQSLAIDAGIDAGVRTDMDREPRFGTPDLGADEYWAPGALQSIYLPLVVRASP